MTDEVDAITFEINDHTIQLVNGRLLIWNGIPSGDADIDLPLEILRRVLSTADMLRK